MATAFFMLLIGLQLKHFVADFLLQPGWILAGKGDIRLPGGYAHAGIHAVFTAIVLAIAGVPVGTIATIMIIEFVLHYGLDYAKVHYSKNVDISAQAKRYWGLFGVDQLAHQITYMVIGYVGLAALGFA
jgi:hypothetical protein